MTLLRRGRSLGPALIAIFLLGSTGLKTAGYGTQARGVAPPAPETVRVHSADELLPVMPRSDYYAETRRNLKWIEVGGQRWLNYSFFKRDLTSLDPDWPISLIFYGQATREKVKKLFGKRRLSTRKFVLFQGGADLAWGSDSGTKIRARFDGPDGIDEDILHLRVFAPPEGYFKGDGAWGHYVIATAHFDFNPPFDNICGYGEDAESLVIKIFERQGFTVFYHQVNLLNEERFRAKKHHYRQSDGFASLVYIP